MKYRTDYLRMREIKELLPPAKLLGDFPITEKAAQTVYESRQEIHRILHGADDRAVLIAGPCSIHDTKAAKEYATLLKQVKDRFADDLLILMRVYFEKPRTTVGWKGLINDPHLDGSYDLENRVVSPRRLLSPRDRLAHRTRPCDRSCRPRRPRRVGGARSDRPAVHRRHAVLGRD